MRYFYMKRYLKGFLTYSIILVIFAIVGVVFLCALNNYIVISLLGINFVFSFLIYFSLVYLYYGFEDQNKYKKAMFISMGVRFLSIILAIGLSILFMVLTNNMVKPNIYYIFMSPTILLVGYLLGNLVR